MKTLNRFAALALCALLAGAGSAHADESAAATPKGPQMEQELGLTPDQAQQVRTIMQEQAEKRRSLWQNTADRKAVHEQMRALHEETRQRLSAILSAEQMARMETQMQERHGQRDQEPGEHIARELQLSAEQETKVKQIFTEIHAERQAIMDADTDREAKHGRMQALHAEMREKMAAVLDAGQLSRFDAMHTRHMQRMERRDRCREKQADGEVGSPDPGSG
ncbi:MAG: Spy/CpxP family protein refolding chaperone [Gammaproteobacteria bacterium]|nr:Spy/CpxP family protein refolding chaperone [Gammaproteobacteria bacterium]